MDEYFEKNLNAEIKDFDDDKFIVDGYINAYDVLDSHGDISDRFSFVKTIGDRSSKIRVHKNHNPDIVIGAPIEFDIKDSFGLRALTEFRSDEDAHVARDMYQTIKFLHSKGQGTDISIGAWVVKRDPKNKARVLEYKMKEYSFLTGEGSNPLSSVLSIKSITDMPTQVIEYLTGMYNLPYSDKRLKELETILKSLTNEPSGEKPDFTRKVEPIEPIIHFDLI